MDKDKVFVLLVTLATVACNLVFALTGISHTVSCNLAIGAQNLMATAYAATLQQ